MFHSFFCIFRYTLSKTSYLKWKNYIGRYQMYHNKTGAGKQIYDKFNFAFIVHLHYYEPALLHFRNTFIWIVLWCNRQRSMIFYETYYLQIVFLRAKVKFVSSLIGLSPFIKFHMIQQPTMRPCYILEFSPFYFIYSWDNVSGLQLLNTYGANILSPSNY